MLKILLANDFTDDKQRTRVHERFFHTFFCSPFFHLAFSLCRPRNSRSCSSLIERVQHTRTHMHIAQSLNGHVHTRAVNCSRLCWPGECVWCFPIAILSPSHTLAYGIFPSLTRFFLVSSLLRITIAHSVRASLILATGHKDGHSQVHAYKLASSCICLYVRSWLLAFLWKLHILRMILSLINCFVRFAFAIIACPFNCLTHHLLITLHGAG